MQSDMYVFPARKFQITAPGSATFTNIAWMLNRGYVAVSGLNGTVRVMLLNLDQDKTSLNPWYASQQLEGHNSSAKVLLLSWNEVYHKLVSADDSGIIIVWTSGGYEDAWYEEMLNNRQKARVMALRWSNDGTRVAIAYDDGHLIIGTVDGNKLWTTTLDGTIKKLTWNGDDSLLLLGLADGEVHAYDIDGKFQHKVTMICVENIEMETALSNGHLPGILPRSKRQETLFEEPYVFRGRVPDNRPRFLVAYQNGNIQLMLNDNSLNNVSIIRLPSTSIIQVQWSPDGKMFAVAGVQVDMPDTERNVLYFFSAYGAQLQKTQLPAGNFTGIAWESSGLRLGVLIDTNIFLFVVKYPHKWGYFGNTLTFVYEDPDTLQQSLIFYDTQMQVRIQRFVENVCCVRTYGDYCVIIFRTDEIRGAYNMQLCDGIGTPIDSQSTRLAPDFVAMNGHAVILATIDSFIVWRYVFSRKTTAVVDLEQNADTVNTECKVYYIDQNGDDEAVRRAGRTVDNICAVCVGTNFFFVGRESGAIHRFNLATIEQQAIFKTGNSLSRTLALNCVSTRLALVTDKHVLKFYDIPNEMSLNAVTGFERKEVWAIEWDAEKDDMLAIMEKQRLVVVRDLETEDPVACAGRICQFRDLSVRTVLLDEVVRGPDQISKFHFVDIEIKVMKTVKELLLAGKTPDAIGLIERRNHPKLWNMLARAALKQMDFVTAERAFVRLHDYGGIQFLKRLRNIQSEAIRRAEMHVFLGELEAAERIYFDNDRRDLAIDMLKRMHDWPRIQQILQSSTGHGDNILVDLAIDMLKRMHDWPRIQQILQSSTGHGDDILVQQTWKQMGDYYLERQNWKSAITYYEHTECYAELAKCFLMLDDFAGMEAFSRQVPNDNPVLQQLAEIFTNYGLCEQAIDCYLRCGKIQQAFETCIRLNEWDKASELSDRYQLADVKSLLDNYVFQITGNKTKNLAVAQLHRKAANYLQAAKIIFEIANNEHLKQANPLRLKKLHVMAALIVEEYHLQSQQKLARSKDESTTSASIALEEILRADQSLSIEDTQLIEGAWRKAEAYHFFMLAHKQLYQGSYDAAMKTALTVAEYEDLLDPIEIYSLLALSSYLAGCFGVCSKAFMKLESLPNLSLAEQEVYLKLALQIFMKNAPHDDKPNRVECTSCETPIPDYTLICPNLGCGMRFPVCVASGRPLYDYQFWLCPSCKHRAYEREMQLYKFCPLCHYDIST